MAYLGKLVNIHTEYALFDQFTANLIRLGLKEGCFSVSSLQTERAKHVDLSASLIERLPLFDEAIVDELLTSVAGLS